MDVRSTLKDIAVKAGVSAVTVHKAIYGKAGISEKTRQRVLKIAEEMNYSVNAAAASLKRDVLNIAVILPMLKKELNYFFYQLWDGIEEAKRELLNFRVLITRFPCDETWQNQAQILEKLLERDDIDGVVVYCWDDTKLNKYFERLKDKGIPVVTVNSDAVGSCRIGCVTAPNERTGMLAAELLSLLVPGRGHIIILAGNRMMKNLREITLGFFKYIQKHRPDLSILELNDFGSIQDLKKEFGCLLSAFNDVAGVYCNSARNDIPMCEVLRDKGVARKVKAIGSDVFEELVPYLAEGTMQATIWQDQKSQAKDAVMMLYNYLTTGQKIEKECCTVRNGIIMYNNYQDYL